jgi:hypothetical protein
MQDENEASAALQLMAMAMWQKLCHSFSAV